MIVRSSLIFQFAIFAQLLVGTVVGQSPHLKFSDAIDSTWEMGVEVSATAKTSGIIVTGPLPIEWDEQTIEIVDEKKSANVSRVSVKTLDKSVKQFTATIPKLSGGEKASIVFTVKVRKKHTLDPNATGELRLATQRETSKLRKFLLPSPFIESKDKKIISLASTIGNDSDPAWEQVRDVFDWVRENVEYKFDTRIKSCLTALDNGVGDCEEMSSLFIAICRAKGIPARAIWVPGHTYPEFYLVGKDGKGIWFPCQVAGGNDDFGRMPEDRPILQKGDNFRIKGMKKPMRYVQPTLRARNANATPKLIWIMKKSEQN